MKKKIKFKLVEPEKKFYFDITWGKDKNSYVPIVDDYAKIVIRSRTEQEAREIFKEFIKAIKKRSVKLIN